MFTDKHGVEKHIPPVGQVQINGKNMAQPIVLVTTS